MSGVEFGGTTCRFVRFPIMEIGVYSLEAEIKKGADMDRMYSPSGQIQGQLYLLLKDKNWSKPRGKLCCQTFQTASNLTNKEV